MTNLLTVFQLMSSQEAVANEQNPTYFDMSAASFSTFLDIGSGFGKPVFHAALQTGCSSYGVEIVPARVTFCEDQKYNFIDYYQSPKHTKYIDNSSVSTTVESATNKR